jgi:hypothetical protein
MENTEENSIYPTLSPPLTEGYTPPPPQQQQQQQH